MHTAILFIVATIAGVISSPLPPPSSLLSRECHFNRCPKTNLAGDEFSSSLIVRNTLVCRYVGSDDSCTYSTVNGKPGDPSQANACAAASTKVCQQAQRRYKKEDNFTAMAARENARAAGPKGGRLGAVKKALTRKRPNNV